MTDLSISIVTYHNPSEMLGKLLHCTLAEKLKKKIFVIDNSSNESLKHACNHADIKYIHNSKNVGYGAGHNIAIKKILGLSKYHLVVNPDIYFEPKTLENLFHFMESNPNTGLVMPKILYPDGSTQYLCRLLPTPADLLVRRLAVPFLTKRWDETHALKFTRYNKTMEAPYLSGCFMFIRNEVFLKTGLFDERFFMYMEDVDLSRRIGKYYKNIFFPKVSIYHAFKKDSYNNFSSLTYHIKSAIKYFNKWGWFFDKHRSAINNEALRKINIQNENLPNNK